MRNSARFWPLKFYFYQKRSGLSHRLRLRLEDTGVSDEERRWIEYYESHTDIHPRCFGVYQRLWFLPLYISRPDIQGVFLDEQFFHGIPTSVCFFSFGCSFILVEKTENAPFLMGTRALHRE